MRRKVSTLLDESLFRRAKLEAAIRGKQISEILGEALEKYFEEEGAASRGLGVVAETWDSISFPLADLEDIMGEEDWIES